MRIDDREEQAQTKSKRRSSIAVIDCATRERQRQAGCGTAKPLRECANAAPRNA